MFFCFIDRTLQACASQTFITRLSAVLMILGAIIVGSSCGGGHSSPFTPTTAGNSPAAGLNISGTLPSATVGTNYSGSLAVSGGTGPYTFAVASGQLPNGIALAKDSGSVSGTPSSAGTFNFVVSALDAKGNSSLKSLQIPVADNTAASSGSGGGASSGGGTNSGESNGGSSNSANASSGKSFSNIQRAGGWGQYGQGPPNFVDCSPSPCDGISFWMQQGVNNPSKSGSATQFNLGGTAAYSDALWNNHIIGPFSSQGTFDGDRSMVPAVYNFTYDVDFYGDNLELSEALEFDINQFFGGMGFIFGHECNIANGHQWSVFDNQKPNGYLPAFPAIPTAMRGTM